MVAEKRDHDRDVEAESDLDLVDLALKCCERAAVIGLLVSLSLIATTLPSFF